MTNIEIISASAGSGKTYRIAEALTQAVIEGTVRAEAVVAMTFTNKAAAELKQRVRTHLLQAGRAEDAQKLAAARIGTINSVCGQLVREFAFDLGLSPEQRVLDDKTAQHMLHRSLSEVLTPEVETELADVWNRMGSDAWQSDIERIVTLARTNGISAEDLPGFAERCINDLHSFLGDIAQNENAILAELEGALHGFVDNAPVTGDTTKTTADAIRIARRALRRIEHDESLPWSDWAKLATLKPGKKSKDLALPVQVAAAQHDNHPALRRDVQRAVELVFDLAKHTLNGYQEHKRQHGVIDFVDQETYARKLLSQPEFSRRLEGQIDLVVIDEFQDTSPIQLAIFLQLATIAKRSIWVGDQKQAIYGFRGTDPALMDAVIEELVGEKEPETLEQSWRSRPSLVKLSSDLFAPAFALRGIPEERCRLKPAKAEEAEGLGPVVEWWTLESKNKQNDASALASAIKQMLQDQSVVVRDQETGKSRPVRASDVAVLCRKNDMCGNVAAALESQDIRAVLPRTGLFGTVEGIVVLAGLKLWIDSHDTLAAAQLSRLLDFSDADEDWLSRLIQHPGREAFSDIGAVRCILAARERHPHAGAIEALQCVLEALDAFNLCRRWGNAQVRIANLEALHSRAVAYAGRCVEEGRGCTPVTLVRYFLELAVEKEDDQGLAPDQNAVNVCTWHKAKGLEWPITVLFELKSRTSNLNSLGVRAVSAKKRTDLSNPLGDRWIRYWPYPYGKMRKDVPFVDRLKTHAATASQDDQELREALRLLYVGWTRARDRVVIAGRPGEACSGALSLLDVNGSAAITEPDGSEITWAAKQYEIIVRDASPEEPVAHDLSPDLGYPEARPRQHPPAFVRPSQLTGVASLGEPESLGERFRLTGSVDMERLGNAIHGFLAADRSDMKDALRREIAARTLKSWTVAGNLEADDLLAMADRLKAWVSARWPKALWRHEWPLFGRTAEGSMARGQVDLMVETETGVVIIDHKSFPGSEEQALERAAQHAGQLSAYADIIKHANTERDVQTYIHLPILGMAVPVLLV